MASVEPFIGEIGLFAGFVPRGWLPCEGQVLQTRQYTALFSLIGSAFGGDGRTTFALPDLRGAVPMGEGQGPGLSAVARGQHVGTNAVALTPDQTAHRHTLQRKGATGFAQKTNSLGPNANLAQVMKQWDVPGNQWELVPHFMPNTNPDGTLHPATITSAGGGQAHENRQPYLGLHYGIAYDGEFPPRP